MTSSSPAAMANSNPADTDNSSLVATASSNPADTGNSSLAAMASSNPADTDNSSLVATASNNPVAMASSNPADTGNSSPTTTAANSPPDHHCRGPVAGITRVRRQAWTTRASTRHQESRTMRMISFRNLSLAAAVLLTACGAGSSDSAAAPPVQTPLGQVRELQDGWFEAHPEPNLVVKLRRGWSANRAEGGAGPINFVGPNGARVVVWPMFVDAATRMPAQFSILRSFAQSAAPQFTWSAPAQFGSNGERHVRPLARRRRAGNLHLRQHARGSRRLLVPECCASGTSTRRCDRCSPN